MEAQPGSDSTRVGWFELFYDLVLVATLVGVNADFLDDPTPQRALLATVESAALFTTWLLTTLAISKGTDLRAPGRALIIVQMATMVWVVTALGKSTAIPPESGMTAFGLGLLTIAGLWWQGQGRHRTAATLAVAGLLALASTWVPPAYTWLALATITAIASIPAIMEWTSHEGQAAVDPTHIGERMGLFILIVLGLSFGQLVMDMGYADTTTDPRFFALMFIVMFAVWWMYFGLQIPEQSAAFGPHRRAWITAHYLLLIGVAGLGDVISALSAYPDDQVALDGAGYLGFAVALVLVGTAMLLMTGARIGRGWLAAVMLVAILAVSVGVIVDVLDHVDLRTTALGEASVIVILAIMLAAKRRRAERTQSTGSRA